MWTETSTRRWGRSWRRVTVVIGEVDILGARHINGGARGSEQAPEPLGYLQVLILLQEHVTETLLGAVETGTGVGSSVARVDHYPRAIDGTGRRLGVLV
jgi:hypothetical protein